MNAFQLRRFADCCGRLGHETGTAQNGCNRHDDFDNILPSAITFHAEVDSDAIVPDGLDFARGCAEEGRYFFLSLEDFRHFPNPRQNTQRDYPNTSRENSAKNFRRNCHESSRRCILSMDETHSLSHSAIYKSGRVAEAGGCA